MKRSIIATTLAFFVFANPNMGRAQEPATEPMPATELQHETDLAEPSVQVEPADTDGTEQASSEVSIDPYDAFAFTFIFLMFAFAIICGQWAIQTKRNFWAWYIAGLFTGPLAGGAMLHRTAIDVSGQSNPGGCGGAIAGLLIPAAGWLIWLNILY